MSVNVIHGGDKLRLRWATNMQTDRDKVLYLSVILYDSFVFLGNYNALCILSRCDRY